MSFDADVAPSLPWIATLLAEADAAEARGNDGLAIAILRRACEAAPAIRRRLGLSLIRAGRMPEAAEVLRGALLRAPEDPEIRYGLGLALIALGRLREGEALAEARFELARLDARKPQGLAFPEWRGEPVGGKRLAVFPELGLSDQILAARYLPVMEAAGAQMALVCPSELHGLYAESFPGVRLIEAGGAVEPGDADVWTTICALPGRLAGAPPSPPYLRARAQARRRGGAKTAVALAGLPEAVAERLREGLPGRLAELTAQDLAAAAAVMAEADVVVCLDGPLAQVASGLGRPSLALVPARGAHWSFGVGPQSAAWHPTARIFRADPRGDWDGAVERLLLAANAL
jgi:hypothetical protein